MKGPKPKITLEQYRRIREVGRLRAMTPSDKELAREFGVAQHLIHQAMHKGLLHHDVELAKEAAP